MNAHLHLAVQVSLAFAFTCALGDEAPTAVAKRRRRTRSCAEIRAAIETLDFARWTGLPRRCAAKELFDGVPDSLEGLPTHWLGDDCDLAFWKNLHMPRYYRPTLSFRPDGRLILFDGMIHDLPGGLAAFLRQFGPPEARLDWDFGIVPIPGGEWAYPRRGITIFVSIERDRVHHVALYHPTTLKHYRRSLRPHLAKEPLPGPEL